MAKPTFRLPRYDKCERSIVGMVVASLPELDVAYLQAEDGSVYTLERDATGLASIEGLREGQLFSCSIEVGSRRIVKLWQLQRADPRPRLLKASTRGEPED